MLTVFQQPHAIDDDMLDPGGDRLDARTTVRQVVHQLARSRRASMVPLVRVEFMWGNRRAAGRRSCAGSARRAASGTDVDRPIALLGLGDQIDRPFAALA